jgi:Rieske 2Fe-2S family protein
MSAEPVSPEHRSAAHPGLPGRDYCSPEIFQLEKERIFYRSWFCIGREERLPTAGDFLTEEIAGEDILVVRTQEGELRAFYNVCRHRGTKLCEASSGHVNRAFVCPYHAWSYALDGRLQKMPNVRDEAGIEREQYGLRPVSLETWDGFIFVNLAANPRPLRDQLEIEPGSPLSWSRYRIGELRIAHRVDYEIRANWKILHDNFNECLHCPSVHPELAKLVPLYRTGQVVDPDRVDGGVTLDDGLYTFTLSGRSALPKLPSLSEIDSRSYYGYSIFPNLMANLTSTGVVMFTLYPRAADHTTLVSEFLFRPEVIARDDFDCSDMVKFVDLVSVQDWAVCERVQRGVASRGFDRGVYPPEDGILHEFAERYLAERGPVPAVKD